MIEQKDVKEAIDRIARSADGQMLYRFLQRTVCGIPDSGMSDGALRQFEGRRSFAAELMAHMAEGIADSDRYAITFARANPGPDAQSRPRGAGRRVTADTFVPGWDAPAGPGTEPGPAGGDAA